MSPKESKELHQEYASLLEKLPQAMIQNGSRFSICNDISQLKSIARQLDISRASVQMNNQDNYSSLLSHSAIRNYCQFLHVKRQDEMSARLKAHSQLLQARDKFRRQF